MLTCIHRARSRLEAEAGLISVSGLHIQLNLTYHLPGHCSEHFPLFHHPNNPLRFYENPHFPYKEKSAGLPWHIYILRAQGSLILLLLVSGHCAGRLGS